MDECRNALPLKGIYGQTQKHQYELMEDELCLRA
jgi:hypothetical protein